MFKYIVKLLTPGRNLDIHNFRNILQQVNTGEIDVIDSNYIQTLNIINIVTILLHYETKDGYEIPEEFIRDHKYIALQQNEKQALFKITSVNSLYQNYIELTVVLYSDTFGSTNLNKQDDIYISFQGSSIIQSSDTSSNIIDGSGNLNVGYISDISSAQPINTMLFNKDQFNLNFQTDNSINIVTVESTLPKYLFNQPGHPIDCTASFLVGSGTGNDSIQISWSKPFNIKAGTNYNIDGERYFYETAANENWLPHFSELILDISGIVENNQQRHFAVDSLGFPDPERSYAKLSSNNTKVVLEATTANNSSFITNQGPAPNFKYINGSNTGQTTVIRDTFSPSSSNYAGGIGGLISLGNTYDFRIYYRNESLLSESNPYNYCDLNNIIFGVPGFIQSPTAINFWPKNSGSSNRRYYVGGVGPATKDFKNTNATPVIGLNLPWSNDSLIKVGYTFNLKLERNSGNNRIQIGGINERSSTSSYSSSIENDFTYNIDTTSSYNPQPPATMTKTKEEWPVEEDQTPQPNDDYIKLLDEQDSNINSGDGKDHPEHTYTVTEYKAINDTLDDSVTPPRYRDAPVNPTSSWSEIIPIFKRSICNNTGFKDYDKMFLKNFASTSITYYFNLDFTTNTSSQEANLTNMRERQGSQTPHSVYIIPSNNTLLIKNKYTFRQLANYGEPKDTPTIITDLVLNNDYIGTKGKDNKLGDIEFKISNLGNNTIINTITHDIYGWNLNESLNNTNNQQRTTTNNSYDMTLTTDATFDIADQNNIDTKGYYLGFNISDVEVDIDIYSNNSSYQDIGDLGYNPYIMSLKHTCERPSTASETSEKTFNIKIAEETANITMTNVSLKTTDITSSIINSCTDFFGVKRLPPSGIGGADDEYSSSNRTIKLFIELRLNDVSDKWIPNNHTDKLVELDFIVNTRSLTPNPNGGNVDDNNRFYVKWNDPVIKNNALTTINWLGTSGSGTQCYKNPPSPFYVEITEGQTPITENNKYSRILSTPIFKVGDDEIKFANNVGASGNANQTFDLTTSANNITNEFKFKNTTSSSQTTLYNLFWDYTWPVISSTSTPTLPSTISGKLIFYNLYEIGSSLTYPTPGNTSNIWGNGYSSNSNKTNINLPNLDDILTSNSGNLTFDHSKPLKDYQCMWCYNAFRGPFSTSNNTNNPNDNPYIDYKAYANINHGSTNVNYSSYSSQFIPINYTIGQNAGGASGGLTTSTSQTQTIDLKVKFLLFKLDQTNNTGKPFKIELKNTSGDALSCVNDYCVFYCEHTPNSSSGYQVKPSGSTSRTQSSFSGWLNPLVNYATNRNTIDSFPYSINEGIANTYYGSNNGCGVGQSGQEAAFATNPEIYDFGNSNVDKYILIGISEDINVKTINIVFTSPN